MSIESCTGEEVKNKEKSHLLDEFMDTSASGSAGFTFLFPFLVYRVSEMNGRSDWILSLTLLWSTDFTLLSRHMCAVRSMDRGKKSFVLRIVKSLVTLNVQLGTDYTDYFYNIVLIMRSFNKITLVSLCKKEIVDHLFNRSIVDILSDCQSIQLPSSQQHGW